MNPIRQLRVDEYVVAERLAAFFKKKAGYSLNIPFNHYQKGFDLLVHSNLSGNTAKIQIKGSTRYPASSKDASGKRRDHKFWFNNFKCPKGDADFYALVGIYPSKLGKTKVDSKCPWETKVLMMPEKDMEKLLCGMRTKSGKPGHSFYLEFTEGEKEVYLTRGASRGKEEPMAKFAVEKAIENLEKFLGN